MFHYQGEILVVEYLKYTRIWSVMYSLVQWCSIIKVKFSLLNIWNTPEFDQLCIHLSSGVPLSRWNSHCWISEIHQNLISYVFICPVVFHYQGEILVVEYLKNTRIWSVMYSLVQWCSIIKVKFSLLNIWNTPEFDQLCTHFSSDVPLSRWNSHCWISEIEEFDQLCTHYSSGVPLSRWNSRCWVSEIHQNLISYVLISPVMFHYQSEILVVEYLKYTRIWSAMYSLVHWCSIVKVKFSLLNIRNNDILKQFLLLWVFQGLQA